MNNTALIIIGFSIIFLMTTAGAALVFFFKDSLPRKVHALLLGFAGGVMIAASVWSLLIPAIDSASDSFGNLAWFPAAAGVLAGGLFLVLLDVVIPHIHGGTQEEEGPRSHASKTLKLFLAVTIHNIPEGLAVGFAFGAAAATGGSTASMMAALGLSIGIAIQNFPEGAVVSLPMRNVTGSRRKAFLFGMGSGAVEPIAALIGFFLSSQILFMQPWLLSFAAGAMLFVVAEDLIPDANLDESPHFGTWGVLSGFIIMMILDVAFG